MVPNCRDEEAWRHLFKAHAPSFELTSHGTFGKPTVRRERGAKLRVAVEDPVEDSAAASARRGKSAGGAQKWFVLTRGHERIHNSMTEHAQHALD